MTFIEVAEKVLSASKRSMKPEEIVAVAMDRGWLLSGGKTPAATMNAALSVHIKRGDGLFVRTSPGHYALNGKCVAVCKHPAPSVETKKDSGYVYILTNPSFRRDWVKIGMTERPVNTRSKELDNTAVPLPFEIYATLKTNHRRKIEHLLHGSIDDIAPKKRIRKTREFFNIAPEIALKLLVRAAEVFDEEQNIDEVFKHGQPEEPAPKPQTTPKAKRIAFSACSETAQPPSSACSETWSNVTQLAKLIARRGGNEGAFGGILHYFSRKRACVKSSKWRRPLEDIGIKFDANDFVSDWQCAKKVL